MRETFEKFFLFQDDEQCARLSIPFVKLVGANAAFLFLFIERHFFDTACYQRDQFIVHEGSDGWFELPHDLVKEAIGLGYAPQTSALKTLEKWGFIHFIRLGNNSRRYVRFTEDFEAALLENEELRELSEQDPENWKIGYLSLRSSVSET